MKDIDEIRRDNLRQIEAECGGASAAARLLEMSPSQFMNLRDGAKDSKTGKRRGMRKETARRIERYARKPPGWLDVPLDGVLSGRQMEVLQARQSAEAQWLLSTWQQASEEDKEIARFALSGHDAPLPPWADKDMRQYVNGMRYAALRWLREEAEAPKKIAV